MARAVAAALFAAAGTASAQEVTIRVQGGDEDIEAAVERASLTAQLDPSQPDSTAQDFVAAARADYRRILTALYGEGYYGPAISIRIDGREASSIAPLGAPSRIGEVLIAVEPGPRFRFGVAEIAPTAPGTELPEGFRTGEIARADTIGDAARAGVTGWREVGYPLADVSGQEITAIHPQERLDARIALAPGPQLNFGRVTIDGNEDVREARIRAIAGIPEGALYDPDEVEDAAIRLRRTGAFDTVAIVEAETPGPNGTLPIEIQVSESLPRRIGFGAEIATQEGLSLSAFWLHRNFFGGAEKLRLEAEVSGIGADQIGGDGGGIDYRLGLEFVRPATFRRDTDLTFDAQLARVDEEDYLSDSFEAAVGLTRYVNDELILSGGPGLLIAREERDGVTRDYQLVTFALSAEYDRCDVALDPTSGFYIDLDLTPFYGLEQSETGLRLFADTRAYLSFGEGDRVTLAGRVMAGSVLGIDDLLGVPADYLFYSGGGGTVRGQPYRSLSLEVSQDGSTIETGGASFLGAQLEARVRVTDSIEGVVFADVGTISAESFPDSDSPWHAGVGIGARYLTPIGPIRLDIGTPATGDDAFEEVQFYIGIGQAF